MLKELLAEWASILSCMKCIYLFGLGHLIKKKNWCLNKQHIIYETCFIKKYDNITPPCRPCQGTSSVDYFLWTHLLSDTYKSHLTSTKLHMWVMKTTITKTRIANSFYSLGAEYNTNCHYVLSKHDRFVAI